MGLDHDEEDLVDLQAYQESGFTVMEDDFQDGRSGREEEDDDYQDGDDWKGGFGGGGYDDTYDSFYNDTDRRHYGPGLHTVWFGRARMLVARHLYATNCIQVGGGKVPYYEYCEGCSVVEAQR